MESSLMKLIWNWQINDVVKIKAIVNYVQRCQSGKQKIIYVLVLFTITGI